MSDDGSIEDLLASDDPGDRLEGVRRLGGCPRPQAVPALMEALSDPDDEVSGMAATKLRGLATVEAVPALVREYTRPERFPGTHHAEIPYAWALEEIDAGEVWEPLVDALEGATEPAVVNRCVRLLADLGDVRSRPALERLADLETEGDLDGDDVRAMKASGAEVVLDEIDEAGTGATSTLDDIRRTLEGEDYDERLRAERRLQGWCGAVDTEALLSALRDDNDRISAAAAKALGTRGAVEAVPGLVREVSKVERCVAADVVQYPYAERSDLRHGEHARALVRIGDPAAVGPLLDALDRSDYRWVRWEILWILGQLGDTRALEPAEAELERLGESGVTGWRHRALVSDARTAVTRLRKAAESE